MTGFKLGELHAHWDALKERGRVAAERVPLPIQKALQELGVAEVDPVTLDLVMTENGWVGHRKLVA